MRRRVRARAADPRVPHGRHHRPGARLHDDAQRRVRRPRGRRLRQLRLAEVGTPRRPTRTPLLEMQRRACVASSDLTGLRRQPAPTCTQPVVLHQLSRRATAERRVLRRRSPPIRRTRATTPLASRRAGSRSTLTYHVQPARPAQLRGVRRPLRHPQLPHVQPLEHLPDDGPVAGACAQAAPAREPLAGCPSGREARRSSSSRSSRPCSSCSCSRSSRAGGSSSTTRRSPTRPARAPATGSSTAGSRTCPQRIRCRPVSPSPIACYDPTAPMSSSGSRTPPLGILGSTVMVTPMLARHDAVSPWRRPDNDRRTCHVRPAYTYRTIIPLSLSPDHHVSGVEPCHQQLIAPSRARRSPRPVCRRPGRAVPRRRPRVRRGLDAPRATRPSRTSRTAAALAGARYVQSCRRTSRRSRCARRTGSNAAVVAACDVAKQEQCQPRRTPTSGSTFRPSTACTAAFPRSIQVRINTNKGSIFGGVIGRAAWPVGVNATAANQQGVTYPFGDARARPDRLQGDPGVGHRRRQLGGQHPRRTLTERRRACGGIGFSRTGGGTVDVTAPSATCRSAGSIQDQGSGSMTCAKTPNSFALPDPLRNLPAPTYTGARRRDEGVDSPDRPLSATAGERARTGAQGPTDVSKRPSSTNPHRVLRSAGSVRRPNRVWVLYPGLYPGRPRVARAE